MQLYSGTAGGNVEFKAWHQPTILVQTGLAGAEEVVVQVYVGSAYQDLLDDTGAAVKLTATQKNVTITAVGALRLNIDASAGTCTVAMESASS